MTADCARRTELRVFLAGTDITEDVNRYLQSCTYTDNEKDEVDSLELVFDDRENVWLGGWLGRGTLSTLSAVLVQKNALSDGRDAVLDCGSFEIYSVSAETAPARVTLKAGSVPLSASTRTERKSKAWAHYSLSGIAAEIAQGGGMEVLYLAAYDPQYSRKEQLELSDLAFLEGLCRNAGVSLKATGHTLVLFDPAAFEQKGTVRRFVRGAGEYSDVCLETSLHDAAYTSCTVSYTDPKSGETFQGEFTAPGADDATGQTLRIRDEAVSDDGEAAILAEKRLREKNSQAFTASITLPGDTGLVAGVNLALSGWGLFDGTYAVTRAVHSVGRGGYTTKLSCRRALEGY